LVVAGNESPEQQKKPELREKKKKKKKGGHRQNWVGSMVGKNTFEKDVGNNEVH
jgi:hypothetical protein